jgi:hypothetical protein
MVQQQALRDFAQAMAAFFDPANREPQLLVSLTGRE